MHNKRVGLFPYSNIFNIMKNGNDIITNVISKNILIG